MSERLIFVVPDGTKEKVAKKAAESGFTQSAFLRKLVVDNLKAGDLKCELKGNDLELSIQKGGIR